MPARSPLEAWFAEHAAGARWDLGGTMVPGPPAPELAAWLGGMAAADLGLPYGETDGSPVLRAAVAAELGARPGEVIVTGGATEANFLALLATLAPGDDVILQDPLYGQFEALAGAIGARIRRWPVPLDPRVPADLGALAELVDARTRLVVVNSPHNPTGRVVPPEALAPVLAALEATPRGLLLVDEVYRTVTPSAAPASAFGASGRVLVTDGLSKRWGLPGLRIGWLAGPADVVGAARAWREVTTHSASRASEGLAERLWPHDAAIRARGEAIAARNRARVAAWLAEGGWPEKLPGVGVVTLLRMPAGTDDVALAIRLRAEVGVFVVPGSVLGCPGTLRIGFGHPDAQVLDGALSALSEGLAAAGLGPRARVGSR